MAEAEGKDGDMAELVYIVMIVVGWCASDFAQLQSVVHALCRLDAVGYSFLCMIVWQDIQYM
jgi:hypothetical protein